MKLYTIIDVYEYDIRTVDNDDDPHIQERGWNEFIRNKTLDIKRYHNDPEKPCGEELCMWCNFLYMVRDSCIPDGHMDCELMHNTHLNADVSCHECIKDISWYKRLI